MKVIDYLIIGQGIAGSVLAYTLQKFGLQVMIVDPSTPQNASKAASGVCNPITGRRPVKTWLADEIFPFLHDFYAELENKLETGFFHRKEVYRPFDSVKDQNEWYVHSASWEQFVNTKVDNSLYEDFIDNPQGGWETKGAGFIKVDILMEAFKTYFQRKACLINGFLNPRALRIAQDGVSWEDFKAGKIIFCEGARVMDNPYFNYLPHRPDKGEWIKIHLDREVYLENMIKKNIFIIPLGNQEFLVSGTYHQNDLSYLATKKARKELCDKLDQILKIPYTLVDQRAGIRPSTPDRRPFIGLHPVHPNLGIFNGFGTKGLSLAPYLAQQFYEFLELGKSFPKEADISRYAYLWRETSR